jgi:hypothetical protein
MEYKNSLTVHVLKANGSIIDSILGPSYGLMVPSTPVTSMVPSSKARALSRQMMRSSLAPGKTANLRVKVKEDLLMEIDTQGAGSKADYRVTVNTTLKMRVIRETISQIVKMARAKKFFTN